MDTVDLEELPDSCERAGALALWLSCEGQIDVWEMFSDTSYLSAILDRQEPQVAAAIDLRTKKAESFLAAADTGLLAKKDKNPKIVVMSLTFETKDFNKEDMVWQQYHLCIDVAERTSNSWRKALPFFWIKIRKDFGVYKKMDLSQSRESFTSTGVNTCHA